MNRSHNPFIQLIEDPSSPTMIVAELSANHAHDLNLAKETIHAMKESGADAVKLQTYTPNTMTINHSNEFFQIRQGTLWDGKTFYELYQQAYTPWEWHFELKELAEKLGLIFFSTPFDHSSVDFLEKLNVPAYKIASFEILDIPLIQYVASKAKPIIISTGIATLCEIEEAVEAVQSTGNHQIILLKCTSSYPAPLEEVNLRTIPNLADTFGCTVGLSDHTLGITAPVAAVALGARLIEKHFILSRDIPSPDKDFSLTPTDFAQMVQAVRDAEKALGRISYELTEKMKKNRVFGRSLFVVKDMKAGEVFSPENVRSIRPNFGLPPKYLPQILGRQARTDIPRGTPLHWHLIG